MDAAIPTSSGKMVHGDLVIAMMNREIVDCEKIKVRCNVPT